jgi:hypothetical protein
MRGRRENERLLIDGSMENPFSGQAKREEMSLVFFSLLSTLGYGVRL